MLNRCQHDKLQQSFNPIARIVYVNWIKSAITAAFHAEKYLQS